MTKEFSFSKHDTLVAFGIGDKDMDKLISMGNESGFKVHAADSLEDLLAIPCFCIVMNPAALSSEELKFLYNAWMDMGAGAVSVLLAKKSHCRIPQSIKNFMLEDPKLFDDEGILRFRILVWKAVSENSDYWVEDDEQV